MAAKEVPIQLTLALDETAIKSLVQLLAPAIKQAIGLHDDIVDQAREARLRQHCTAAFAGQKPPIDEGLLANYREAAKLLKVSQRTISTMHTTGRMPPPIRIGQAVRWSRDELKKWVDAGCPAISGNGSTE